MQDSKNDLSHDFVQYPPLLSISNCDHVMSCYLTKGRLSVGDWPNLKSHVRLVEVRDSSSRTLNSIAGLSDCRWPALRSQRLCYHQVGAVRPFAIRQFDPDTYPSLDTEILG